MNSQLLEKPTSEEGDIKVKVTSTEEEKNEVKNVNDDSTVEPKIEMVNDLKSGIKCELGGRKTNKPIAKIVVENTNNHKNSSHMSKQTKQIATIVHTIPEEIIAGDEVPESEEEISLDVIPLSYEQNLEVHQAIHILKIYQGKERFWKKVFGKQTGKLKLFS